MGGEMLRSPGPQLSCSLGRPSARRRSTRRSAGGTAPAAPRRPSVARSAAPWPPPAAQAGAPRPGTQASPGEQARTALQRLELSGAMLPCHSQNAGVLGCGLDAEAVGTRARRAAAIAPKHRAKHPAGEPSLCTPTGSLRGWCHRPLGYAVRPVRHDEVWGSG